MTSSTTSVRPLTDFGPNSDEYCLWISGRICRVATSSLQRTRGSRSLYYGSGRKETVQQPDIQGTDADEHEIRRVAVDESQFLQQLRNAEGHHPRIKTHADTAKRFRADAP